MATENKPQAGRMHAILPYALAAVLALAAAGWALQLWRSDLSVPFAYEDDAVCFATWFKATAENGWFLSNPRLGAPFTSELYDFPRAEGTHFLLVRLLTALTADAVAAMNLYYLLSFPLAACFCLLLARRCGLSPAPATACSVLFAMLPFHLMRYAHFPLACYWPVPLAGLLVLWVVRGEAVFAWSGRSAERTKRRPSHRTVAALAICLVLATSELYFTLFACFFLLAAGVFAAARARRLRPMRPAAILIAVMALVLALTMLPNFLYQAEHGRNAEALHRPLEHVEKYGLKVVQMLLPVPGHRLPPLARLTETYKREMLFNADNENESSALGLAGSVGLLFLLGWAIWKVIRHPAAPPDGPPRDADVLLPALSAMTILGILLATVGGLSSLGALLTSAKVRSYNRISVYLALFSLLALGVLLQRAAVALERRRRRPLAVGMTVAVLVLGLLDQTSPQLVPLYDRLREEYRSDADFVRQIEGNLAPGSMIYQLPYVRFPEAWPLPPGRMKNYDPFRGFLHSRTLRWSYGAVKGRPADLWQRNLADAPIDPLVRTLAAAGFSGVWVDRNGFDDRAAETEEALRKALNSPPLVSPNGRLSFFDMTGFVQAVRRQTSDAQWAAMRAAALEPVLANWTGGFGQAMGAPGNSYPYCESRGELELINLSSRTRAVRLNLAFQTLKGGPASLTFEGPLLSERLAFQGGTAAIQRTISLPPGEHRIRFSTDAEPFREPRTGRNLTMKVAGFSVQAEN